MTLPVTTPSSSLVLSGFYYVDPSFGAFKPVRVRCVFHENYAETCVQNMNSVRANSDMWIYSRIKIILYVVNGWFFQDQRRCTVYMYLFTSTLSTLVTYNIIKVATVTTYTITYLKYNKIVITSQIYVQYN